MADDDGGFVMVFVFSESIPESHDYTTRTI